MLPPKRAALLSAVLLSCLTWRTHAAELLLAVDQATPAVRRFAADLQQRRPQDELRLIERQLLDQLQPAADSRMILLGDELLDWRRWRPELPPSLILQVSRLQGERRMAEGPLPAGITLLWSDPPPERQMQLIRLLMPHVRRVGVLLSPQGHVLEQELQQAARRQGLALRSEVWDDSDDSRPLGRLLDQSDVLLGLDDPRIFNPLTIKQILLTSYDQRKALIGPTAAFVRAGSLASSYSSSKDWLDTLDQLLDLPAEQWPRSLYPGRFRVSSNDSVARSLGIERNDDAELTRLLQRKAGQP